MLNLVVDLIVGVEVLVSDNCVGHARVVPEFSLDFRAPIKFEVVGQNKVDNRQGLLLLIHFVGVSTCAFGALSELLRLETEWVDDRKASSFQLGPKSPFETAVSIRHVQHLVGVVHRVELLAVTEFLLDL